MRSVSNPTSNGQRFRPVPSVAHLKPWDTKVDRPNASGSQGVLKRYEWYMALARSEAQSGDLVGAENYYQHAEHFVRSISATSDQETPSPLIP